ncbi:protein kinase family protein [Burkholderia sp. 9777_1386]|uniref:protein kinase family protein n=1 Tax=Burkholderia sp. 9777_1386 TaxID=2751183 RepID=UPI0018C43B52|nr:protein kinase family protein [Burkholderia sp. 9777_1386]MBG0869197.1 protein kinase family protein [Burkholderia sp. 9777_1386]
MNNQVIKFVRQKDFVLEKRLGQGATGNTVLLHDPVINERFACKKYAPANPKHATKFFESFVREIKLLHLINHPNIVRVFNYYLFPEQSTGYILMEYADGQSIDFWLFINPETISDIFAQTINGFAYLEENGILHRDIRDSNILVTENGTVKIIDFGFGKQATKPENYDKSISLNWWCDLPNEFKNSIYDFRTEVYFVGKLFEKLIADYEIEDFEHADLLDRMCKIEPENRIASFSEVRRTILTADFGASFTHSEKDTYRTFADGLSSIVSSIEEDSKYHTMPSTILTSLETAYKKVMLEDTVPDPALISRCFVNGGYKYIKSYKFQVNNLKRFIDMFRKCSSEKQGIIIANLHARLDAKTRYPSSSDDIPF